MNLHDNTALLIHSVERASEPDDLPDQPSEPSTPVPPVKVEAQPKYILHKIEVETAEKLAKANKSSTEFLYLLANEPSIGLYHVQEHVRKSVNKFSETKAEMKKNSEAITEALVDVDYALLTVKSLVGLKTFSNIQTMLLKSHQIAEKLATQDNARGKPIGKPQHKELTSYRENVETYTEVASPSQKSFAPMKLQTDQSTNQGSSSDFLAPKKFE
mmetsp:Transcript_28225/g.39867  ORF Transcript_28225/g.39867 Transcript_28225/m.39867 type:complete len:215 (-) Transcript_28225:2316-2960(-)